MSQFARKLSNVDVWVQLKFWLKFQFPLNLGLLKTKENNIQTENKIKLQHNRANDKIDIMDKRF